MTTRGLGVPEFTEIANIIADRLLNPEDSAVAADCRRRVAALCDRFPLYPHLVSGATEPAFV
jgi:glycine hydroxymethyltransferase